MCDYQLFDVFKCSMKRSIKNATLLIFIGSLDLLCSLELNSYCGFG